MEDKVKRESRQYVEKLFKKYDKLGCGAVTKDDMYKIMVQLLDTNDFDHEELEGLMVSHVKESKYTVHNKEKNMFEVKYRQDTLDFPSVLAIGVKFLVMADKRKNQFSGTNLVNLAHFDPPKVDKNPDVQHKRRIF